MIGVVAIVGVVTVLVVIALSSDTSGGSAQPSSAPLGDWHRVQHDEAVFGGPDFQVMNAAVAFDGRIVAVGADANDAAVWILEADSWERIAHDDSVFGGAQSQDMRSVITFDGRLVAVGADGSGGDTDAAVWLSNDGRVWDRISHDEAVFGGPTSNWMNSIAVSDGTSLVAVGEDFAVGDTNPAVWLSDDGLVWHRVEDETGDLGEPNSQAMTSVVSFRGRLIAAGYELLDDIDAAVWFTDTADGIFWTRVTHVEGVFGGPDDQWIESVIALQDRVVAVGGDGTSEDSDAAVWYSDDGLNWERLEHDEALFGGPGYQQMTSAAELYGGIVAVGVDESNGDDGDVGDFDIAVWYSSDGLTWERISHDEAAFGGPQTQWVRSIERSADSLIAVGYDGDHFDRDAAVWRWHGVIPASD